MKKVILTIALFAQLTNLAKAENALTIDMSEMASTATLEIVVYAHDLTTQAPVGHTLPITVDNASGVINIDVADIEWDGGSAPSGTNWGWGYAEVTVSCSVPSGATQPNVCGSLNIDGVTVGSILYPDNDCFEVETTSCSSGAGDGVEVTMGNSGNERPSYPGAISVK